MPFCGFDKSPQPMSSFPRFSSGSQDVGTRSPVLPNFKMCSLSNNDDEDDSNSQDSGVGFDKVCRFPENSNNLTNIAHYST